MTKYEDSNYKGLERHRVENAGALSEDRARKTLRICICVFLSAQWWFTSALQNFSSSLGLSHLKLSLSLKSWPPQSWYSHTSYAEESSWQRNFQTSGILTHYLFSYWNQDMQTPHSIARVGLGFQLQMFENSRLKIRTSNQGNNANG